MNKTISFTNFETDALKRLIASDDCVPLDKEHEQMYAERASHGDSKARTELITHNMRLVESIAKHYQGQGFVLDDLVGYGNEGLIKAVDSYDCSRGCGFASYAQYWIKSSITSKMSKDRPIHMPLKKSALRLKVLKTMAKFEDLNGYRMSEYELADMLGVPVKAVLYVLNENKGFTSLYDCMSQSDDDDDTMEYNVKADEGWNADYILNMKDGKEHYEAMVKQVLPERDAKLFLEYSYYYAQSNLKGLRHLADKYGFSAEELKMKLSNCKRRIQRGIQRAA